MKMKVQTQIVKKMSLALITGVISIISIDANALTLSKPTMKLPTKENYSHMAYTMFKPTASDGLFEDEVQIRWNRVSWAKSYEIRVKDPLFSKWSSVVTRKASSSREGRIHMYEQKVRGVHEFSIRACDSLGFCSKWSVSDPGEKYNGNNAQMPLAPLHVNATDGRYEGKIGVSWSGVSSVGWYQLYQLNTSNLWEPIKKTSNIRTHIRYEAPENIQYTIGVAACNAAGCSNLDNTDVGYANYYSTLEAPKNFKASDGKYRAYIQLHWDEVPRADGYKIYKKELIYGLLAPTFTFIGTTRDTSFIDRVNTPHATEYAVAAVNDRLSSTKVTDFGFADDSHNVRMNNHFVLHAEVLQCGTHVELKFHNYSLGLFSRDNAANKFDILKKVSTTEGYEWTRTGVVSGHQANSDKRDSFGGVRTYYKNFTIPAGVEEQIGIRACKFDDPFKDEEDRVDYCAAGDEIEEVTISNDGIDWYYDEGCRIFQ